VAGAPSIARMKELGVARVSVGSGFMRSAMGHTRRIAQGLMRTGTYEEMIEGSIAYVESNSLFLRS
jgi:2-methylisocitrate lyase-like PEP mutase family enzyme